MAFTGRYVVENETRRTAGHCAPVNGSGTAFIYSEAGISARDCAVLHQPAAADCSTVNERFRELLRDLADERRQDCKEVQRDCVS